MINGIINIYKEPGFTSHDVVAKLRGIVHQKKIGHTGTLDPDAVGVLPVCLGKATKVCEFLTDETKTYEALLLLGRSTDTQDTSGSTLEEREVNCEEAEVIEAVQSFVGEQMQIPPMYSALKVNGKKLYELAREGKTVERKARPVHFYEIEVLEMKLPEVRIRVTCSKGTYIRTLCNDIGEKLGCGGCMAHLERTRVGSFDIGSAVHLSEVQEMMQNGSLSDILIPVDQVFAELEAWECRPFADALAHNGNKLPISKMRLREDSGKMAGSREPDGDTTDGKMTGDTELKEKTTSEERESDNKTRNRGAAQSVRVYDSAGAFIGIFHRNSRQELTPDKIFYDPQEN